MEMYARFENGLLLETSTVKQDSPGVKWYSIPEDLVSLGATDFKLEDDKVVVSTDSLKSKLLSTITAGRKAALENLTVSYKNHTFKCDEKTRGVLSSKAFVASNTSTDKKDKKYSTDFSTEEGSITLSHNDIVKILTDIDAAVDEVFTKEKSLKERAEKTKERAKLLELFSNVKF